jgi:hypothetical protein
MLLGHCYYRDSVDRNRKGYFAMTTRAWFTDQNTSLDLDLDKLNEAARIIQVRQYSPITHSELTALRASYQPDLTAQQIVDEAEKALIASEAIKQRYYTRNPS